MYRNISFKHVEGEGLLMGFNKNIAFLLVQLVLLHH